MKVIGKFNADIVGFNVKRNQAHDGREAFLTLEMGVDKDEAKAKFGEAFDLLAFGTMYVSPAQGEDDTDQVAFMQDTIRPGKRCVFERHQIVIAGHKLDDQPDMLAIRPIDGSRKVSVRVRIGVDVGKTEMVTFFGQHVGETVKVQFNPKQGELELPKAKEAKQPKLPGVSKKAKEAKVEPELAKEAVQ